jgi:hypothetical protein
MIIIFYFTFNFLMKTNKPTVREGEGDTQKTVSSILRTNFVYFMLRSKMWTEK